MLKIVKKFGNSAHILVKKEMIGQEVFVLTEEEFNKSLLKEIIKKLLSEENGRN